MQDAGPVARSEAASRRSSLAAMDLPPTSLRPFVTVSTERVLDARIFGVDRVRRRSQDRGGEHDYWRLQTGDWVNVIPITRRGEVVLVRQERHGIGANTLETPGGLVDPGEAPAAAALREMEEETGYRGGVAEPLGWVHPNPAIQSNRLHMFLARDVVKVGAPTPDAHEEVEVLTVPLTQVRELVRRGVITHALVVCALYLLDGI